MLNANYLVIKMEKQIYFTIDQFSRQGLYFDSTVRPMYWTYPKLLNQTILIKTFAGYIQLI
jgi:hypothetical protein